MKSTIDNAVKASFGLWLDNQLLAKGQGYGNFSYPFLKTNSDFRDYDIFKSPHAQWVYDSAVGGAQIPTGVSINGNFTASSSGVVLGYNDGRVLISKAVNATNVSGSYAFKEVNVYYSNTKSEKLLFDTKFNINPRGLVKIPSEPSLHTIPAIFIKYDAGTNVPYALGGEDKTIFKIRAVIIADSSGLFDSICGLLRDSVRTSMALLDEVDTPFSYLGGFKTGITNFNYQSLILQKTQNSSNLMFISKVHISPFSEEVNNLISTNITAGFADFEIEILRFPRI